MAPRESPPSPASLSGEVRARRSRKGTARYREIRRFRAEDFGRVDLPRLPVRAGTRSEAPQGPRIQDKAASRQRQADEAIPRAPQGAAGTAFVAAPGRRPYRCPQGHHEAKSPRHLKLRWRSPDLSGGGERVARVSPWHEGRQGRSAGVSAVTPRGVCSRDSDVPEPTSRYPVRGGGHRPERPTSSEVGSAFRPSCSHDKDFWHGWPVPYRMGETVALKGRGTE